jgi:hypothetical protein
VIKTKGMRIGSACVAMTILGELSSIGPKRYATFSSDFGVNFILNSHYNTEPKDHSDKATWPYILQRASLGMTTAGWRRVKLCDIGERDG